MQAKWAASVCAVVLILGLDAIGQESGNSNDPILKTRPNDRNDRNTPPPQQGPAAYPGQGSPLPLTVRLQMPFLMDHGSSSS